MRRFRTILYIPAICIIIVVTGCARYQKPTLLKLSTLPEEGVCRIAALPFINETKFTDGNIIFYRVFISQLNQLGNFQLSPEGDVRDIYMKMRLTAGARSPDFNELRIIGNFLNVPLLLQGYVLDMGEIEVGRNIMEPYMTVILKIFDVQKGQTVWTTYYNRRGEEYRKVMHFGVINTITRLSSRISKEILTLWESEGFIEKCSEITD